MGETGIPASSRGGGCSDAEEDIEMAYDRCSEKEGDDADGDGGGRDVKDGERVAADGDDGAAVNSFSFSNSGDDRSGRTLCVRAVYRRRDTPIASDRESDSGD